MTLRLLAVGFAIAGSLAWSKPFHPALYLPIAASVVRVEADVDNGRLSVGSGVTVAPSVIATNCHVVRDAVGVRISGGGTSWPVDAEFGDTHRDVCLLRAPGWTGAPVAMADTASPAVGSTVVALGFTGGAPIMPRVGNVRALHDVEGGEVIEGDAPFNSGASGGGLFDEDGVLVGLLAFRMRNSPTSFYALPIDWIRAALRSGGEWKAVQPIEGPQPFWQAGEEFTQRR